MRAHHDGARPLGLARKTAVVLFLLSVALPAAVVLHRTAGGVTVSSSDEGVNDAALLFAVDAPQYASQRRPGVTHEALSSGASSQPAVAGTRVLVFVVREHAAAMELHVRIDVSDESGRRGVCAGDSRAGETHDTAAQRILSACAGLGPPPDVEFLQRADAAPGNAPPQLARGAPAPFVALVRTERLMLRGSGAAAQSLAFAPLQTVLDDATSNPDAFAPGVASLLPVVRAFLAPWVATAGKNASACP